MTQKPTLIFVPGAWHGPSTWDKVTSILESKNYKCICIALPSVSSNTSISLLEDIDAVRNPIIAETTEGRNVVVVMHSYGGVVGVSAIKDLTPPKQTPNTPESRKKGHVIGLAIIASGFISTNKSFLSATGGIPPPSWTANYKTGYATPNGDIRELFYHDLAIEEGDYWVGKLGQQALKPFTDKEGTYAGWMDVPVWYLSTTVDKALPWEWQKMFVGMAREEGAEVVDRVVDSGHSPMLSRPVETAEFLVDAVMAFGG